MLNITETFKARNIDVRSLTEKQLRKLAEVKQIQERLKRDGKIWEFEPQPHQEDFFNSTSRIQFVFGGNRSGKSICSHAKVIKIALGTHPTIKIPVPNYGWVVSVDFPTSREVSMRLIQEYLPKSQIVRWDKVFNSVTLANGSVIGFKSCDSGAQKFQGTSKHYILFDEEPDYEVFKECKMRVIDTNGFLFGAMTPTNGMSWTYDSIWELQDTDPAIKCFNFDTLQNKYLSKEALDDVMRDMDEDEKAMRLHGKFIQLSGLVYKEYKRETHVIPSEGFNIPKDWKRYRSIDHGINNPTACLWAACDREDNLYVYDEYYESNRTIKENAENIRQITAGERVEWSTIDPSTQSRDAITKTSIYEEYRKHGIPCKALRTDKSQGISRVKQYLRLNEKTGKPKLFILDCCYNLIKEISRYRWANKGADDKNAKEEPQKFMDHALDALRYMIMSNPRYDTLTDSIQPETERWY